MSYFADWKRGCYRNWLLAFEDGRKSGCLDGGHTSRDSQYGIVVFPYAVQNT